MSLFKRLFGKKDKVESKSIENVEAAFEENEHSELSEGQVEENADELEQTSKEILGQEQATTQESAQTEEKHVIPDEEYSEEVEEVTSEPEVAKPFYEEEKVNAPQAMNDEGQMPSDDETENIDEIQAEDEQAEEILKQQEEVIPQKQGFIKRLFSGLSKTRDHILKGVDDVLSSFKHIDEELYEELEEALIMADFGVDTTLHIMEKLRAKVKEDKISDPAALKPALQSIITAFLTDQPVEDILNPDGPTVVLVIGVNGVGKTTSIGKLSHLFKSQGKRVLVAAADTFRAAAIEQLNVWTERAGVEIIKHDEGSDAAAVVFDAISAAKSRKADVLICDTAGRLQNKTNLMKELEKISRIIAREYPEAKKEILIVIDATTGQNALQQVKLFKEVADISGIVLTKLDGTAKGGAIVGIYESLKVPVKYIGVGEKMDDLQPFDAHAFAKALFENEA